MRVQFKRDLFAVDRALGDTRLAEAGFMRIVRLCQVVDKIRVVTVLWKMIFACLMVASVAASLSS